MINEKIKKLANKLEELIPKFNTPQEVYNNLLPVIKQTKDYFMHLGPDNVIKLVIYIYSLKNTKNFDLGDKMIDKLLFAEVLTSERNAHIGTCENCGGDSYITCDECNGTGNVDCSDCEGTGSQTCGVCDGRGEEEDETTCTNCYGDGTEDCEYCDGSGEQGCENCGGEGDTRCHECDGTGEIISDDEIDYSVFFIVTWNRQLKEACELREGTLEPIMTEDEFDKIYDEYIVLSSEDNYAPLDVEVNEMYCLKIYDEPNLFLQNSSMLIRTSNTSSVQHLYI